MWMPDPTKGTNTMTLTVIMIFIWVLWRALDGLWFGFGLTEPFVLNPRDIIRDACRDAVLLGTIRLCVWWVG
jgi:hypothetical protein